jgi:uncharacterized protein YjbI with pentapeptide repeats
MNKVYKDDKEFTGINFFLEGINIKEYENCIFENCIFSKTDLTDINFIECEFKNCDFSLAKVTNTAFIDVEFKGSKLLGVHFEDCNKFVISADFEGCKLNLSSFYKLNLRNIKFKDSNLQEVDFTGANLTGILFDNCNLLRAIFVSSILEKADFRTAYNYSINPESNRLSKAKFSMSGILGLLDKYNIEVE